MVSRRLLIAVLALVTFFIFRSFHIPSGHAAGEIVRFTSAPSTLPRGGSASAVEEGKFWIGLSYTADFGTTWVQRVPPSITPPKFLPDLQPTKFISEKRGWLTGFNHVWATGDGGHTWSIRFDGRPFAFAFSKKGNGWTAVGDHDEIRNYITQDWGETWHECGKRWHVPAYAPYVSAVLLDSGTGWTLIAQYDDRELGLEQGVAKTEDGGCTWQPIWWNSSAAGPNRLGDLSFSDTTFGWLSSINEGPLLETRDGGVTWQSIPLPDPNFITANSFITRDGEGFVDGYTRSEPAGGSGFYFTANRGQSWQPVPKDDFVRNRNLAKLIPASWNDAAVRRMYILQEQKKSTGR
jgi:photosystem II stability/assembly factor-like uncharacterized protein